MTSLRPFWRYYGGKWRNAPHYPQPEHDTIVEPFAGAAGYSLRYAHKNVILIDANPKIAAIWRYLIATPADEIRALPDIPEGGTVNDCDMPQAARWLAGFWVSEGSHEPKLTPTSWSKRVGTLADGSSPWGGWGRKSRDRVASQVDSIRHWRIIEGDYRDAPDIEATWHVDPPYSTKAGSYYPNQPDGFPALGEWCKTRRGLVMVCEQDGADWMPFMPVASFRSLGSKNSPRSSSEVIWLNRSPVGWGVQQGLPLTTSPPTEQTRG